MKRKTKKRIDAGDEIAFDIDDVSGGGSSGEAFSRRSAATPSASLDDEGTADEMTSPVFSLLARPTLPELKPEARARLMMQSPSRLYFYWSVRPRSYHALERAVGGAVADYRLVLRLLDLSSEVEELHAIDAEGSWWFNVRPDTEYRAEVGFYSASRPFVRILFSNAVRTPRKAPSPHSDAEARWAVTTHEFVKVLDASGFDDDAFEVVGHETDGDLARKFARHIGADLSAIERFDPAEIRRSLAAIAAGATLEDLKFAIAAELYSLIARHIEKLSAADVRTKIRVADESEYETFSAIGGSLVNIPRRRYRPVSSLDLS